MREGPAPWVLVSGSFHEHGGMDRANATMAEFLARSGAAVHLVSHHVDPRLMGQANVRVHLVPRPLGSYFLGEGRLARRGREVARSVSAADSRARVLVNGGNCAWPDVNWVHAVHHAWPCVDHGAPLWFRAKNRVFKSAARRRERSRIRRSALVIANSAQTARHLVELVGVDAERIRIVYLGSDPMWGPPGAEERAKARARLAQPEGRLLVLFVGALGHDQNKGMDTLWAAWRLLSARPDWDVDLVVAGGGAALPLWRARVAKAGQGNRVRVLGFTERIPELLAAADLLVSPSRYDAYGLNVQEAICRGVPALVSARAGVAERYPKSLSEMILPDPEDAEDLARRLHAWRPSAARWRERFAELSRELRVHTRDEMCRQIVSLAESAGPRPRAHPTPTGSST